MLHACHDDEFMLDTTLTPIVKTKTGDVTDMNNDRPIAVATSMSKVMELLIHSKTECFLNTSDNQFGFKKKHGTDMCIHAFRQTIAYYKQNSSPVFMLSGRNCNSIMAQNTNELQQFLGIATYMSSFVPCLSHHSAVLRELVKRDTEYVWLHQHAEAFSTIKSLICKTTTLAYFDTNKDSVLQVDSSQKGLGAVLMQDSRPIAFAIKSLIDTESRYANIERELLAVVYACERFHTYLYGKPFVVQYDHKPLEMIQLKNLHAAHHICNGCCSVCRTMRLQ